MRGLLAALLVLALWGCEVPVPQEHPGQKAKAAEPAVPLEAVLSELYCFRCHSVEGFSKGPFPHETHMGFDLHCNQCHRVRGHQLPELYLGACQGCHQVGMMHLSQGGYPAVFDHQAHAQRSGCKACHPEPFRMKRHSGRISMQALQEGRLCGICHNGKEAFASTECGACHRG